MISRKQMQVAAGKTQHCHHRAVPFQKKSCQRGLFFKKVCTLRDGISMVTQVMTSTIDFFRSSMFGVSSCDSSLLIPLVLGLKESDKLHHFGKPNRLADAKSDSFDKKKPKKSQKKAEKKPKKPKTSSTISPELWRHAK